MVFCVPSIEAFLCSWQIPRYDTDDRRVPTRPRAKDLTTLEWDSQSYCRRCIPWYLVGVNSSFAFMFDDDSHDIPALSPYFFC